jgi:hypothetical protein
MHPFTITGLIVACFLFVVFFTFKFSRLKSYLSPKTLHILDYSLLTVIGLIICFLMGKAMIEDSKSKMGNIHSTNAPSKTPNPEQAEKTKNFTTNLMGDTIRNQQYSHLVAQISPFNDEILSVKTSKPTFSKNDSGQTVATYKIESIMVKTKNW